MSELRVDNIVDMGGSGAPKLRKGANVTGVSTITQAVVGNATINAGGINATGIVTSSSNKFVGDFASGNITAGVMTATSSVVGSNITINSGGVNASGIVSATSYRGSGANLTGVGLTIAPISYNPDVSESDAALTGIGLTFNQRVFAGVGTITLSLVSIGSTVAEVFGLGNATSTTYTVTVQSTDSGNKYLLDGNQQYTPVLYPGGVYTFDQSDSSNNNHPLRFSTTSNGSHGGGSEYTTGVETNGTPGNSGAYTRITISTDTPSPLYYYCTQHSGMGANITVGAVVQFNNDADPPNITITPKTNLTVGQRYAINYPPGAFIKNTGAGSSYVGTGYTFTARTYDYQLWVWGRNDKGQLGLNEGTNADKSSPVQVPGTTWTKVNLSSAIKTDGTLWAWGNNEYGQTGDNTTVKKSSPIQIGSDTTWNKIYVGKNSRNFQIKTDGTLWASGYNNKGQLGTNSVINISSPVQIPGTTWNHISTGELSTHAVKTDGTLWVWGDNEWGELGLNNRTEYSSPVQIPGTTWNSVKAGERYSCATKTDGTAWAWGNNEHGQLGLNQANAQIANASSPTQIPGTDWASVFPTNDNSSTSDGGASTQMLQKTNGSLWFMGYDSSGAMAMNMKDQLRSSPTQLGAGTAWAGWTSDMNFAWMSSANRNNNVYGVTNSGELWGTGSNSQGQLGQNGINSGYSSPIQIPGTWSTTGPIGSSYSTLAALKQL